MLARTIMLIMTDNTHNEYNFFSSSLRLLGLSGELEQSHFTNLGQLSPLPASLVS